MLSTCNAGSPRNLWGKIWNILLLSACLALSGGPPAAADQVSLTPQADAIVRCDPSSVFGYTDGTVSIDLYIQDVVDLYGADLVVTFDTSIASVVDQDSSQEGVQIQLLSTFLVPGFTLFQVADNTAGTIHYATTQLNPQEPATGSGPVARVTFQPKTYGEFTMTFTYHMLSDRSGVEIPSISQTCFVDFDSPLAVQLADFVATYRAGDGVMVAWETVSEQDNAGFNVYRSEGSFGDRPQQDTAWVQLNTALIPTVAPGSSEGHAYIWIDGTAEPGTTYWYRLEDVALDGTTTQHAPVAVTVSEPNAVGLAEFRAMVIKPLLVGLIVVGLMVLVAVGRLLLRRDMMNRYQG